MLTIIAQAPHYCLQWMDAEHTILKLEIAGRWSVFQAVEVLHLLRALIRRRPATTFDMIVCIDDGAQIDLRGLAFGEIARAVRSPSPNMRRVVFCGRYRLAYAVIQGVGQQFYPDGRGAPFTYVACFEEALDLIRGCRP